MRNRRVQTKERPAVTSPTLAESEVLEAVRDLKAEADKLVASQVLIKSTPTKRDQVQVRNSYATFRRSMGSLPSDSE